jgi:hypothetical protein
MKVSGVSLKPKGSQYCLCKMNVENQKFKTPKKGNLVFENQPSSGPAISLSAVQL